jgi:molybdopterin/thiamine biosynthesis adenylyltransferase
MRRALNPTTGVTDEDQAAVFSRERLAGYDPDVVAGKCVLVAGAGALGQNTLIDIALSGVGELRIVDHDLFEPHNRTRSPCYPTAEEQRRLGLEKARITAWRLLPLATPAPRTRFAVSRIQELGLGAFAGVDVVVSCVDNARARAYLADVSRLVGLPLIEGGFDGAEISLSCFPPARGRAALTSPCWRCSHQELAGAFSCRFTAERAEEQGVIPAIQAAAATLAGIQAEATIMALHGRYPLGDRVLDFDIRQGRSRLTTLATDPACPGAHRSLGRAKRRLTAGPATSVRDLLAETQDVLGGSTAVRLREPFVATASCSGCRCSVSVNEPLWSWAANPFCVHCGGFRLRIPTAIGTAPPAIFVELDDMLPGEILDLRCEQVGLGPRDLIEVIDPARRTTVLQLNGNVSDIFEQACEQECAAGRPRRE